MTPRAELMAFWVEAEERVVTEVTRRLSASALEHYRRPPLDLRPRIEALVAAYRAATAGDGGALDDFLADVGRKRLHQGYGLAELLALLDTLCDVAWEEAAAAFAPRGAASFDDLRRLADVLKRGKSRLALLYVAETAEERAALGHLSAAFSEFLKLRKTERGGGENTVG